MLLADSHADQLHQKIFQEVQLGRIAGPFKHILISNLHCSPIGVVPKTRGLANDLQLVRTTGPKCQ